MFRCTDLLSGSFRLPTVIIEELSQEESYPALGFTYVLQCLAVPGIPVESPTHHVAMSSGINISRNIRDPQNSIGIPHENESCHTMLQFCVVALSDCPLPIENSRSTSTMFDLSSPLRGPYHCRTSKRLPPETS